MVSPTRGLPEDQQDLVRLAARGDEAAFARIVRLHHTEMAGVCFVVCGDVQLSAEAVAKAWPVAWEQLRKLKEPDRLQPWLCSVAAVETMKLIRRHGRPLAAYSTARAAEAPPAVAATSDGSMERQGGTDDPELAGVLVGLEPADRALLALRNLAGLTTTELGRAVGMPPPAAEARLERLFARLQEELGPDWPDLGEPDSDGSFEARLGRRLRAWSAIPVRPVDADAAASEARSASEASRNQLWSVVVAALLVILFTAWVYGSTPGRREGTSPPSPSPTSEVTPSD